MLLLESLKAPISVRIKFDLSSKKNSLRSSLRYKQDERINTLIYIPLFTIEDLKLSRSVYDLAAGKHLNYHILQLCGQMPV